MKQDKMLKQDMIDEIALISGLSKRDSERFLDAYHYMILRAIKNNKRIKDVGFFDMYVSHIPSGKAYQPNKDGGGQYIDREPCNRFVIKVGDIIKQQVNPNKFNGEANQKEDK